MACKHAVAAKVLQEIGSTYRQQIIKKGETVKYVKEIIVVYDSLIQLEFTCTLSAKGRAAQSNQP